MLSGNITGKNPMGVTIMSFGYFNMHATLYDETVRQEIDCFYEGFMEFWVARR